MSGVRFPEGATASYPMDTGGSYPRSKTGYLPLSSDKVNNAWSCTYTPPVSLNSMVLN